MFAWLFGAESSFSKALVYNLLTGSVLMLFGAVVYSTLVGLPLIANAVAKK